ncbi:hypothetical protein LCGC14_1968090, partial [marine sediment metagenome]
MLKIIDLISFKHLIRYLYIAFL